MFRTPVIESQLTHIVPRGIAVCYDLAYYTSCCLNDGNFLYVTADG